MLCFTSFQICLSLKISTPTCISQTNHWADTKMFLKIFCQIFDRFLLFLSHSNYRKLLMFNGFLVWTPRLLFMLRYLCYVKKTFFSFQSVKAASTASTAYTAVIAMAPPATEWPANATAQQAGQEWRVRKVRMLVPYSVTIRTKM